MLLQKTFPKLGGRGMDIKWNRGRASDVTQ